MASSVSAVLNCALEHSKDSLHPRCSTFQLDYTKKNICPGVLYEKKKAFCPMPTRIARGDLDVLRHLVRRHEVVLLVALDVGLELANERRNLHVHMCARTESRLKCHCYQMQSQIGKNYHLMDQA